MHPFLGAEPPPVPPMRPALRVSVAASLLLMAACSDQPTQGPADSYSGPPPRQNVALAQCPTVSNQLTLFTSALAPLATYNVVAGTESSLYTQFKNSNNIPRIWEQVQNYLNIRQVQKPVFSTTQETDFRTLVRYMFCGVNIPAQYPGGDAWVVPNNIATPVTFVSGDQQAAIYLPVGSLSVTNPGPYSLIAITPTTDTLRTNLDKYPIVRNFSKYPSNQFAIPAGIALCAKVEDPSLSVTTILNRLKLGHNLGTSAFEILPPDPNNTAKDLNCDLTTVASRKQRSSFLVALERLLPRALTAQVRIARGSAGISGTASELSPIGPVDPLIKLINTTTPLSYSAGTVNTPTVSVRFQTERGRGVPGVTVNWSPANGTVAPQTSTSSNSTVAATRGTATTVWTLPTTAGNYSLTATPVTPSGDAVTGTTVDPAGAGITASVSDVTLSMPTLSGTNAVTNLQSFTVTVRRGTAAYTCPTTSCTVSLQSRWNGEAADNIYIVGSSTTLSSTGTATFAATRIKRAGTHIVQAYLAVNGVFVFSNPVTVTITPGPAAQLRKIDGDNRTELTGRSSLPYPRVQVLDAEQNAVTAATTVQFMASNNSSAVAPASVATSTTVNPSFATATAWPLRVGRNNLVASLDATPSSTTARWVEFTGTGSTTASTGTLVKDCRPSGSAVTNTIATYAPRWNSSFDTRTLTNAKVWLTSPGTTPAKIQFRIDALRLNGNTVAAAVASATMTVVFSGTSTETKEVNFDWSNGLALSGYTGVVLKIVKVTNTSRVVNFLSNAAAGCGGFNTVAWASPTGANFRTTAAMQLYIR